MNSPKISIVCPSYNHEKYVKFFIDSVLSQTIQDFELIIVDDCSSDNTVFEIEKYNDKRIKLIKHSYNKGINSSLSDGIKIATSDIICTIASDDMLFENYIENILNIFNSKNVDAVYVSLDLYDEGNNSLNEKRIFQNKPISEILQKSFIAENQLPSPGMAFKKDLVQKFLPFTNGLIQYSDWDLHNKLLLACKSIFITDKTLIKYRVSTNSTSARSEKAIQREKIENDIMMNNFLNMINFNQFKDIFNGMFEKYGTPTVDTVPYFLGRIALESKIYEKQMWGYKTILEFISKNNNLEKLNLLYKINYADIISLIPIKEKNEDEFKYYKNKIKKYKKRYKILILFSIFIFFVMGVLLCLK